MATLGSGGKVYKTGHESSLSTATAGSRVQTVHHHQHTQGCFNIIAFLTESRLSQAFSNATRKIFCRIFLTRRAIWHESWDKVRDLGVGCQ